jgi:CheY-like chemotaxis protein
MKSEPVRVLVIDDDEIARELMASTLEEAGHIVVSLPSAIGATRAIYKNDVQAVVLDVMMPDINGDKVAKLLRQNSRGQNLAIVLVSSRPGDELQRLAGSADADAVVGKAEIRTRLSSAVVEAYQARSFQDQDQAASGS